MHLSKLTVENFRAFRESTSIDVYDYTTLVGANNCGKSTLLRALELLLESRKPDRHDWPGPGPDGSEMFVEARFEDVSEAEAARPGIAGVVEGGAIRIRIRASWDEESESPLVVAEAWKRPILDQWLDATWPNTPPHIQALAEESQVAGRGRWNRTTRGHFLAWLLEHRRDLLTFGEPAWTSENISFPQALQQGIPEVIAVPAVRDAEAQTKTTSKGTAFSRLLYSVLLPKLQGAEEYQEALEAIERLRNRLGGDSADQIEEIQALAARLSCSLGNVLTRKATAEFELSTPEMDKSFAAAFGLTINDGESTPVTHQGHGMQSLLVFALLDAVADESRPSDPDAFQRARILLYEEPELYLHPHLMRRLRSSLKRLSENEGWQVIVTTHSPFLIDVADRPQSLVLLRRRAEDDHPVVSQLA
ncbi:MAG: ATP-binding protein, partial [Holophagales bacterium]|nr:ATP-binding protein [Holophagales bacterium]